MKPMAEKDNDSMATVQIKPDYAPSEVYSTASEPPPAYKRQSSSVKIAKITAFTIIVSSFILGSFILASTYLQARVSCDQVQALDSVLEKELMLETLQQVNKELPRADALIGVDSNDEIDLQNLDKEEPRMVKKVEQHKEEAAPVDSHNEQPNESESDSSFSDSEETDDLQKISNNKVPLELDLSDLAAALLQNNKKSRMNCVVERKHAEEIVDSPSKTVNLPFGVNLTTDPKKARITGERISIFCESGNEDKEQQSRNPMRDEVDDVESIRPMFIPYQRVPIPFGQIPNQYPLTHMPQRMMPPQRMNMMPPMPQQQQQPPMIRQMPPPFQHMPMGMRPPMPPQVMQAPHPEPMQEQHVRIHVQQLPFREIHVGEDIPVQIPSGNQELPHIQVQRVPLGLALQRAGITAEDLRNIQRAAEERITDELRRLAAEEAAESNSDSDSNSSEEDDSQTQSNEQMQNHEQQQQQQQQHQQQQQLQQRQQEEEQLTTQQLPMEPRDTMTPPMPDQPQILQIGRNVYGRSLMSPVNIPIPMNQAQADMNQQEMEPERPHYVQPRSIRSTDNVFQPEKRVKKCACDCNC